MHPPRGAVAVYCPAMSLDISTLSMKEIIRLQDVLSRELKRRFPDESYSGLSYYAITRAMQMKFMRLPKPRVKIGQTLPDDYNR